MVGPYGGRGGMVVARNDDCVAAACGVRPGEECCGAGAGTGALQYVGCGQGDYIAETSYRYVGCGGDFARPRRDFTCIITTGCLLLLLPLLLWLLAGVAPEEPFNCRTREVWSEEKSLYCCQSVGVGCTTQPATAPPTPPPTPPPTLPPTQPSPSGPSPSRPVDPFNCAVDPQTSWAPDKRAWCCRIHHLGCPNPVPQPIPQPVPLPILPGRPADPYNCADGFANWQAGWSVGKKKWCCQVHGKGCPDSGGCAPGTSSAPYDCNAGFANWVAGWSWPKKDWCCRNAGKGCPSNNGGCA